MTWTKCSEKLPEISYIESDNEDDPYIGIYYLLYSPQNCMCVGYLTMNQEEHSFNFKELSWEIYSPDGTIIDIDFESFTHWMPLPEPPNSENQKIMKVKVISKHKGEAHEY